MRNFNYLLLILSLMFSCSDQQKIREEKIKEYEGAYRFSFGSYEDVNKKYYLNRMKIDELKVQYDYYCGSFNFKEKVFKIRTVGNKKIFSFPLKIIGENLVESVLLKDSKIFTFERNKRDGKKEVSAPNFFFGMFTDTPPHDLDACIKELKESIANDIKQNIWYPNNEPFSSEEEKDAYIEKLWKDDF